MLKIILLWLLFNSIGFAQDGILKLEYTQTISNKLEKPSQQVNDFKNVFSPSIIAFTESNENLVTKIFIKGDTLYSETNLKGEKDVYITKVQIASEVFFINELTGEKKSFKKRAIHSDSEEMRKKLKKEGENKGEKAGYNYDLFIAKKQGTTLELRLSNNIHIGGNTGLFRDFSHEGRLILEKRMFDKKKGTEVVVKLISIDTISDIGFLERKIQHKQDLVLANKYLKLDSITYNKEITDIFYKSVESGEIHSIREYKGNGKYLLIDFWGTWCKPCMASIPELKLFYELYADRVDVLSMNYKDSNLNRIIATIQQTEMNWMHGIATTKVNKILNPMSHFPGIVLIDDDMMLIVRSEASKGLEMTKQILEKN